MIDALTFMMGEFEASFPTDRRYAKNHMWAVVDGDGGAISWIGCSTRLPL